MKHRTCVLAALTSLAFVLTNNSAIALVYQGLTNTSLGSATVAVSNNQLIISNIGTTGQDGVSIGSPDTLSGGGVLWSDLDPSDALPVGAYLQEQIIGTAGAVTNGVLATLTTTKAGTSNYVMTADYTPIGATNLLVQLYNGTVLVGQTNLTGGPLFSLGNSESAVEDWEWDKQNLRMIHTWWTPHPTPLCPICFADAVAMTPAGFNWGTTTNISATAITASGIPSITITNESASLVYQGLTNTSLGSATLTCLNCDCPPICGGGQLTVDNLGTNGQDGVSIALPSNMTDLEVGWQDLDPSNALPVGAYVQSQLIGTAGAVTNGVLDTLTVTKQCAVCGGSNYVVSADFSPIGASNYTVQAYLQGVLVAQAIASNGAPLTLCGIKIKPDVDWKSGVPTASIKITFGVATSGFAGGPDVTWDAFDLTPNGNNPLPNPPTAMDIVASQVPAITITSENLSLVYQGLTNTSLGSASLSEGCQCCYLEQSCSCCTNRQNTLTVGNLGTNGQDGVSIALNGAHSFAATWQDLDPSNALPVGASVQSQIIGTAGAVTNMVLGSTTVTKAGTSNYVISVDYSPVGSSNYTVQIWNGPNLVAQVTGQTGSVVATSVDMPPICTINPWLNMDWPSAVSITISGGPTVVGTEILMTPAGMNWGTTTQLTATAITASGIPSITITNESVSFAPILAINSIARSSNNIAIAWTTEGFSNIVQVTTNTTASYNTNNFVDLATIVVTTTTTNYTDVGGATNKPTRYYRIREPLQ